jgi:3'-phosphoadenosine 5'-phosphosulfate sulfotransferase (PAPS reductase)/FAD synthetase
VRPIALPPVISQALDAGATLAISISGGKDSQALLAALVAERAQRGWAGPIMAIHADLGRMEWPQTAGHCERITREAGLELVVVRRPQGDLLQEMQDRMEKLRDTGKPHWPSAEARYCTSDQKRSQIDKALRAPHWPDAQNRYCTSHQKANQIDKVLRQTSKSPWPSATQRYCTADQKRDQLLKVHRRYDLVVSAMGLRAGESPARARREVVAVQKRITATALRDLSPEEALERQSEGQRVALDWCPLLDWSEADVWEACGTSIEELAERRKLWQMGWEEEAVEGWPCHVAYVMGNSRLSCAICVLASRADIENGARHNPALYQALVAMEEESGFTFRQDLALASLEV